MEQKFVDSMYSWVADMINEIYGGGLMQIAKDWLELGPDSKFKLVWGYIEAGCEMFMLAGAIFAVIFFIITLSDRMLSQGNSMEMFSRTFIELIIALTIILASPEIVEVITEFGNAALDDIQTVIQTGSSNQNSVAGELMKEADALQQTGGWDSGFILMTKGISLTIPYIISLLGNVLIITACIARGINAVVYGAFMPIPLADVYKDGLNSKGIRYIKKYAALMLQGAVYMLIIQSSILIQGSVTQTSGMISGAFYNLATIFVTLMLIFKSQSIANDILGV